MPINTTKYKVQSKTLIARITPFFLRGKKTLRFLIAVCSPIDSVNKRFLEWAEGMILEAATTPQILSLKWMLKYKLKKYFLNPDDQFMITDTGLSEYTTIWEDQAEQELHLMDKQIYMPEDISDKLAEDKESVVVYDKDEAVTMEETDIVVIAPPHNSSITDSQYVKLIKQYIDPYLPYKMPYTIAPYEQKEQ